MTLQERLKSVTERAEAISKFNPCHSKADGTFCSTGGSGGGQTTASSGSKPNSLRGSKDDQRMRLEGLKQQGEDLLVRGRKLKLSGRHAEGTKLMQQGYAKLKESRQP